MTLTPRDYQQKAINDAFSAWESGVRNNLIVAPTGAGKTIIKAFVALEFVRRYNKSVVIFAHKDVLLTQISLALCKVGLAHSLLCAKPTQREIGEQHIIEYGHSFLSDTAQIIIASVKTWNGRNTDLIAPHVGMWSLDEAHHLTLDTMWYKAVESLPDAVGLGVTATPVRSDGKLLGRGREGIFDNLIHTKTMLELINEGSLSRYRVYTVPSLGDVKIKKSSNDYNQKHLAEVTDTADITGDAVEHYLRLANGKQAITFCVNIEHAVHVAKQFNEAGVSSKAVSSKTPIGERQQAIRDFKSGLIKNLVNCDLFSEGFDVPAVEVVIMLRKTQSYGLFKQQFGRLLRVIDGKEYGILIDHVGNIEINCTGRFLLPHEDPEWDIFNKVEPKNIKEDSEKGEKILLRTCPECMGNYTPLHNLPRFFKCPYCEHLETEEDLNKKRKEILVNDGVLVEFDAGFRDEFSRKIKKVDRPHSDIRNQMVNAGHAQPVVVHTVTNHIKRQDAQRRLRPKIKQWCEKIAEINKYDIDTTRAEFQKAFGVNIFEAQTLSESKAIELENKILKRL